jgi:hypothetical protein
MFYTAILRSLLGWYFRLILAFLEAYLPEVEVDVKDM